MKRMNRGNAANIRIAAFGMLFIGFSALADSSSPQRYEYGTKLDIEKVLSISTRDSAVCEPVEQTMKYIDSSGKSQTLQYVVLSTACSRS